MFERSSAPAAQTIRQDRRLSVGVEIRQRVRECFPDDPPAVGPDPVLAKRQARALDRQKLLLGAVEGDLLLVTLTAAPLPGDL